MRVLITGGAGYIGSTISTILLEEGYQVRVLDSLMYTGRSILHLWSNPRFELVKGDIRDEKVVKEALKDVQTVVHLAAIVGDPACAKQPDLAKQVNYDSSIQLINLAQNMGVERFLFASTCSNYGKMLDPNGYVDENAELRPVSLYAETKVAVEKYLLGFSGDMATTCMRFATVYGVSPRMRFDLTVSEFTRDLAIKKHLIVFGEQFWRPYAHVRDIANGVKKIIEAPKTLIKNNVFNIGNTQENYQKKTLVEKILHYIPDGKVEYVHKEEDPRDYRVSFQKAKEVLGYDTKFTVDDGITEVIRLIDGKIFNDFFATEFSN